MNRARLLLVVLLLLLALAGVWLDVGALFSLAGLQARLADFQSLVADRRLTAAAIFFLLYALLASLSVPGAALVMTLAGGALFGVFWGSVLVSFASSLGAVLACLLSRFLLREFVERKFPFAVERVNAGIRSDGAYYLFGLRLVPVFPFFVINLVMGLTRLPLQTFYWVSQASMLPGTLIYVNAGTQLAAIRSARDIVSPGLALSLALLGLFPWLAKRITNAIMAWHRSRA